MNDLNRAQRHREWSKDKLVGNILAVSWPEVRKTAILYALVSIFHYVFRKKFLLISINHEKAESLGVSVRFWDFLSTLLSDLSLLRPWPSPGCYWSFAI
jgi:zinc/manganese transport system permease protein